MCLWLCEASSQVAPLSVVGSVVLPTQIPRSGVGHSLGVTSYLERRARRNTMRKKEYLFYY